MEGNEDKGRMRYTQLTSSLLNSASGKQWFGASNSMLQALSESEILLSNWLAHAENLVRNNW